VGVNDVGRNGSVPATALNVFKILDDLGRRVGSDRVDRGLVANDGHYPSGAQYALRLDRVTPVVAGLIGR
jgi:hypothetical protein